MESAQSRQRSELPHIVIVGAGFGGLYAAKTFARSPVRVTVIDRHNYHLFRPMLYQVATGLLASEEVASPIRSILRNQKNTDVILSEVTGLDTAHKHVLIGEKCVPYDYLILATGIRYNYFGHEDWSQIAPSLNTVVDAVAIRGKITNAFETAERLAGEPKTDPETLAGWLTFALVGAGATGVEMAGSMAEMARISLTGDFRHINPKSARIILFEAGPRILESFPESLSKKAKTRLEQLGVTVRSGAKVESVRPDEVTVNGESIACRTVVWTAGVAAFAVGKWLTAATDKTGRVKVSSDLSVPGLPDVFVIGDAAAITAPWRNMLGISAKMPKAMPGVAQPAMQEGRYVASLINRRVRGLRSPRAFTYWDKGDMAIVGRGFAVANLKIACFSGLPAWLLWMGVHIFYLIGFANRILVMTKWAFEFFFNYRGTRIFAPKNDESKPNSKSETS